MHFTNEDPWVYLVHVHVCTGFFRCRFKLNAYALYYKRDQRITLLFTGCPKFNM